MKNLTLAAGLLILGAGLAGCVNSQGLDSSGDYYNSVGRNYYQPFQDGSSYHYHHSYYANMDAVSEVGE